MPVSEHQPTVLIVEDDPHIINLISIVLGKSNLSLEKAYDGAHALELINNNLPNLIISDIMMPNVDGYDLRRQLLEREDTRLIPFIFLTAKGSSKDIISGLELNADDYIPKPFEPEVLQAKVLAILRRYAQFNQLLQYDPLTKVFNRRTLESNLKAELHRVNRYDQEVSILMMDLDDFKSLNDTYGHDFGDRVLQKVAAFFKTHLRDIDFIGRIGGEEFIVVMPSTDKKTAAFVADRLRQQLADLSFDENGLQVTISGGVSNAPQDADDMDALIKKADVALYAAKNDGRNKIIQAS